MAMRLSGLMSGMDTESIVQQLVEAKQVKVDTKKKAQTKLEWKQEAWKELNTKLKNLQSKFINNMRFSTAYAKKTTKVSDSSAVSVITGENAVNGVQSLKVDSLAKTGYMTGGEVSTESGSDATALTKMSELGFTGETSFQVQIGKASSTNPPKEVTITGDSTISDVLNQFKEMGLNANFDANNQRLFISSKTTGAASDFQITASTADGNDALAKLGLQTKDYYEKYAYELDSNGNIKTDADGNKIARDFTADIAASVTSRASSYAARYTALKEKADKYDDYASEFGTSDADEVASLIAEKQEALEDADEETKAALNEDIEKLQEFQGLISGKEARDSEMASIAEYIDVNSITDNGDGTYSADATAKLQQEVDDAYAARLSAASAVAASADTKAATKVDGSDAVIWLNDAKFTNNTNTFEINGLTITANATTDKAITLTTQMDTDGIYDMIKNFLKEYNSVINEIDKLYNAESAKDFEPLTDDEKDSMSDSEIEKYEKKIKDSILRRDENLNTVGSSLREMMSSGVKVGGKTMYLYDFGISTLGYFNAPDNEKNAYHIDGDSDDTDTSGNADKLKSMIASDPDTVIEFFSTLSKNLYDKMNKLSSSVNGYRSYGSFYDDKKMKSDYDDYTSKIKEMEEKLNDYEDKWYKKFSKMETAMAKMQSNANAVTGMLGGS